MAVFLSGSYLVKAAIGEDIDNETLGGADTHCDLSGVTDYKCEDDKEALVTIKELVDKVGARPTAGYSRIRAMESKKGLQQRFTDTYRTTVNPLIPS